MKVRKELSYLLIGPALLFIAGCAMPKPYVHPNPNNPIRVVAVLPMMNNTNDVEGPERVREMFAQRVTEWQYVVKPIQEVNQVLKDQLGITLGSQLNLTNPKELGAKLGVDGVFYGALYSFEEKTTGVLNIRRVRGGFKLVDTKTGAVVWGKGQGVKSETQMTKGSAGTLAGAASAISKVQDLKEKDEGEYPGLALWHDLPPEEALGQQYGIMGAFAAGLAEKTVKKATGTFLKRESEVIINMIIRTLPPGPGTGQVTAVQPPLVPQVPQPKMPEFNVPAYIEFGKRDFTADMVMTSIIKSSNEKYIYDARIAKLGDKFRSDVDMSKALKAKGGEMPPGLGKNIFITRPDLKVDYILYPEKNKYLELTVSEEKADQPKVEKKKIGVETINGHPCDKYQVTITYKDGLREEGFLWEAKDLDRFVIRAEMENKDAKSVIEMKNIRLGSPPKALFEVPQGYVKAANMLEIFMEEKH